MVVKGVLSAALLAVIMVVPARADTVYGPDQHPLVIRSWCVHLTGTAFVTSDSIGKRVITPAVGVGFSPFRWGALRLPVVQVQLAEADQSQERFFNKTTFVGSVGIDLRMSDWDNGRFEPQFHVGYGWDLKDLKRRGINVGFGIGF